MIRAVIFDMDGLMIDSERVTFEGYVAEMGKRGYTFTEEFYKTLLGTTVASIYEEMYERFGRDLDMDTVVANVHRYMAELFETEGVPVKRGLIGLLEYLKAHDYRIVVATSSSRSRVDTILKQAKLESYFDGSVCGDEVAHGKPDPETFLIACRKAGVDPSEALVLEDSEAGIRAAHTGGMQVICVPDMKYPEPQYAALAWKIVDSLEAVIEILDEQ